MADPTDIARRYVAAMNAGDIDAMMGLFASGAVMRHPTGVYAGDAAIREFFVDVAFEGPDFSGEFDAGGAVGFVTGKRR